MNLEITRIVAITRINHPDTLFLHTKLPPPLPKYSPECATELKLEVAQGTAQEYCKLNFPGVHLVAIDLT